MASAEMMFAAQTKALPGAPELITSHPKYRWAVVTSASRLLALERLIAAGLDRPSELVCSGDVDHGKPAPDCYALAAEHLKVSPTRCVVFEDVLLGFRSACAAKTRVVALTTSH